MEYQDFLESKIKVAERNGIIASPAELHHSTKPHQRDIILWLLELGAGLCAADTGMGKSHIGIEVLRIVQNRIGGKCLIVTELGAGDTFYNQDPEVGEGARLGVPLEYVTNQREAFESACDIVVTNYERVRNNEFDFSGFSGVWLDEGNYLKNMASETTEMLRRQLAKVKFKFIATATPSPNETLELINYADALGVTDRGQVLTRFFQRNSVKAGELTLHPQHTDDFWMWVYSWAVFIQRPSDLGYDDEGYDLPALNVQWHEVKLSRVLEGKVNREGQKELYVQSSSSLPDAAKLKRASINDRLQAALQAMVDSKAEHWILWHHLEDERKALNKVFEKHESYADVFGALHWKEKERRIVAFSKGELTVLATKPEISGVGCNFQKHCHNNILLGINHSFDEFYQLIKRTHRYGQKHPVNVHVFYITEEYEIVQNLQRKWKEHDEARQKMREIVLRYGLDQAKMIEEKRRSFMEDRKVYQGERYTLINNDCVPEFKALPDNSVDMILTSIPFGNHYEYSDKYNDFGHNSSNEDFFRQMDFLVPELLRVLKPGRIAAIHTKNRIHYGSVTGIGFSVFHRFTHRACDSFEKHGFHTLGFHYVPTDVVAENNQTYRLGYSEMKKDATKMGSGIPEEIWLFRKAPSSTDNAYADSPVVKDHLICPCCGHRQHIKHYLNEDPKLAYYCLGCNQYMRLEELLGFKEHYSLAHWQIDADSFWRSSGNRYLTPQELKQWGIDKLRKWWDKFNAGTVYDVDAHVQLLKDIDEAGKLSKKFTTLPLRSNTPYVWNDVNRMHGLNLEQSRRKLQNHICPMPFDQVDRLIKLYSQPGELIADPFGGLCTTGVRALKAGRRAFLTELNDVYAKTGAMYLREQEMKAEVPTLFDQVA
jgi:DNA modification methylase